MLALLLATLLTAAPSDAPRAEPIGAEAIAIEHSPGTLWVAWSYSFFHFLEGIGPAGVGFEYEHELATRVSWVAAAILRLSRGAEDATGRPAHSALSLGPELGLRFFALGGMHKGLWLGPRFGVSGTCDVIANDCTVGASIGARVGLNLTHGHYAISLNGGVDYFDFDLLGRVRAPPRGVVPMLGLSFGWN